MAAIRRFFEKKKTEAKFKMAGPGRALDSGPAVPQPAKENVQAPRVQSSESAKRAGAAALARFESNTHAPADMSRRSQTVIRAEALKELKEAEKAPGEKKTKSSQRATDETYVGAPVLTVTGVYFSCPLIGPEVLSKDDMKHRIREYLYKQLEEERGLTACLILQTCNTNREKVKTCIQTLNKYLENIIENPTEEKYRKIRLNNKVFQERVAGLEGVTDFLLAAGFESEMLQPNEESPPEEFLVFPAKKLNDLDLLQVLRDALLNAEPIRPQLDRNMKVLSFLTSAPVVNLPPDFYNLTVDELKREQQLRSETVEKNATFRTKAMREQEDARELRRYKFTLLRIRFPDDIVLQGTFAVREQVRNVFEFVRANIAEPRKPFVLVTVMGEKLSEGDDTLINLQLVPAVILNFHWDGETEAEEKSKKKSKQQYLKQDVMALLQEL